MKSFPILLIPIITIGCSTNQTYNREIATKSLNITYPVQPLIVDSTSDEGRGADLRLSLTEITSTDSFVIYKAISFYEGNNVGLSFILPISKPGALNSPTQILTINTLGKSSDNLLMLLSKRYKLKADPSKHFTSSAKVSFVDLNEFARTKFGKNAVPETDAKEMKLFFETDDPNDYAELYLNINDKEHWLELREKDEGYRQQVIKFLGAK